MEGIDPKHLLVIIIIILGIAETKFKNERRGLGAQQWE